MCLALKNNAGFCKLRVLSTFSQKGYVIMNFFSTIAFAQDGAAKAAGPSIIEMLVMPVGFLFIMYFFIIRPQQKRAREQAQFTAALKAGDEIVTTGGLIGRIKSVADTFVSVELAPNTIVKVVKSEVTRSTKA
jgi:preprotein translocase subunit YajC